MEIVTEIAYNLNKVTFLKKIVYKYIHKVQIRDRLKNNIAHV